MKNLYKNYVPIDYMKAEIKMTNLKRILTNNNLNFAEAVNTETGEILQRFAKDGSLKQPCRVAKYENLIFSYYPKSKRMWLSGSLHTFKNNGAHNYDDFHYIDLMTVIDRMKLLFGILPENLHITQIEWGVNIIPPTQAPSDVIIEHCLFHRRRRVEYILDGSNQKYLQFRHDKNYLIKVYNKRLQFQLKNELLRLEHKQLDYAKYCKKWGIGQTLKDLIDSDFIGFRETLLNDWDTIVFYDPFLDSKHCRYRDVLYWVYLTKLKSSSNQIYKNKKRLDLLGRTVGGNIKVTVRDLIEQKINNLS